MTLRDAAVVIGGLGAGLVVRSVAERLVGEPAAVLLVGCTLVLAALLLARQRRR